MYFIEVTLGISCLIFLVAIAVLFFNNYRSDLITNIAIVFVVVSMIIICLGILAFICDAILTCFIIWFSNW